MKSRVLSEMKKRGQPLNEAATYGKTKIGNVEVSVGDQIELYHLGKWIPGFFNKRGVNNVFVQSGVKKAILLNEYSRIRLRDSGNV
jgi:hypothetical protein